MAQSLIPKTTGVKIKNSERLKSAGFGGQIGIKIDRDGGILNEIALSITAQANFLVAPTSVDVRQLIEKINLRSSTGDIIKSLSGQQAYDLARIHEDPAPVTFVPGAGAGGLGYVNFGLELHLELDGAYYDMASSIRGSDVSKLDVEIIPTNQVKAQTIGFIGSTFAAAPNFVMSVDVELFTRPGMAGRADVSYQDHYVTARSDTGTVSGVRTIELDPSNLTREITIHTDDVSAGTNAAVPSDALVGTVTIRQGSRILLDSDFASLRKDTMRKHGLDITGFAVISFGDQHTEFAELNKTPVQIQYEIAAAAPAYRVEIAQDYVKNKMELQG